VTIYLIDGSGNLGWWGNDQRTVQTMSGTWRSIAVNPYGAVGVQSNHTLWSWGSDADGQLGDGKAFQPNPALILSN
jgi:hypothetical protein